MKLVQDLNFNSNCFVGKINNNVHEIELKSNPKSDNLIQLTEQGIYVPPLQTTPVETYIGKYTRIVSINQNHDKYRYLAVRNGIGIIHMDFETKNKADGHIFTLPDTAPVPAILLEVNSNGAGFYIEANQRTVHGYNMASNTRYTINIMGFFNPQEG